MTIQQVIGIYVRKSSNKQRELTLPVQEWLIWAFFANQQSCSRKIRVYQDILFWDTLGMLVDTRAAIVRIIYRW